MKGRTICCYICCLSLYRVVSKQNARKITNISFIFITFICASEPEQDIAEESESFAEVGEEAEQEEVEEVEEVDTDPDWAEDIEGSEVSVSECED